MPGGKTWISSYSGILAVVALLSVSVSGQTVTAPRNDNQIWNETQLVKVLTEKRDLVMIGGIRIGRNLHQPVDERVGGGVAFKVHPDLTIQPTYLFISYQPFPGRIINEHRLFLNVTGRGRLGKYTFTDRNLLERRARHGNRDFTVYRNRLQIDYPARLGSFEFKPFVANEVWYSTQTGTAGRNGWFRNRFTAGIIRQLTPKLHAEFFYLHQNDGVSRPGNIHTFGTFFRYRL
jgi:hypothetical protein